MAGPVGFRGGSDSISSIQGGAESLLGGGEVRPFSPGYDPSVDPGAGLWRDPNEATEPDSPFGLDDACEGDATDPHLNGGNGEFDLIDQWESVPGGGPTGPIPMSQVIGLLEELALKATVAALNALQAAFEEHVAEGGEGGGASPFNGTPSALGAAGPGTSLLYARGDHVHAMPTAANVGAATPAQVITAIDSALLPYTADIAALNTAVAAKQDHSGELDVLAAITSTPTGRSILTAVSVNAVRTLLNINNVDNTADLDKPVSTDQAAADAAAVAAAVSIANGYTDGATGALVPKTTTVNGHPLSSNVVVTQADVGLPNVDNTSDADKPVSTATQAALDVKAPLASPALTGTPTAPTAAPGTDTTQLATTEFVLANAPSSSGFSTTFMLMGA